MKAQHQLADARADYVSSSLAIVGRPMPEIFCCYCFGEADRVDYGRPPSPHIASCAECRKERGIS